MLPLITAGEVQAILLIVASVVAGLIALWGLVRGLRSVRREQDEA